jgi:hypothetical protein
MPTKTVTTKVITDQKITGTRGDLEGSVLLQAGHNSVFDTTAFPHAHILISCLAYEPEQKQVPPKILLLMSSDSNHQFRHAWTACRHERP